jgi:hypothetical protein
MALALGVGAMFFGVVFIIVGWKGNGPDAMNKNLVEMLKGNYPVSQSTPSNSSQQSAPTTSTTGGANSSGSK